MPRLKNRERDVRIWLAVKSGRKQIDVATEYHLSANRVRQIYTMWERIQRHADQRERENA
jgi:hypothetical protein